MGTNFMEQNQAQIELKVDFLKKMLGKGICAALVNNDITEIMANPDGSVWFESRVKGVYRYGTIGEFEAQNFLLQLARLRDLFLNFDNPYIETLLPFNRERIEGTIPPITDCAAFTIRKPAQFVYPLEDYLKQDIVNQNQFHFICDSLLARKNIIVSGGPGTGKTTLTNAVVKKMSEICDPAQRILILEDIAEIRCEMPNVLSMMTSQQVSMTTLLKIAMRSRPDRILVGEVRDGAALALLKSWNTGCPGGIATIHANTAESSVLRLLSLAQEAHVPPPYDLIAETVNVLINIIRDPKHPVGRRVSSIAEIKKFNGKKMQFHDIT
ncbi:MAG: P-type conjugative transfer ATPase TrbB [Gammaproteobacteria bacterium]|nr:P-type conjugative transfer ATPase TrbB [Gammaproteobacteria bacterium]